MKQNQDNASPYGHPEPRWRKIESDRALSMVFLLVQLLGARLEVLHGALRSVGIAFVRSNLVPLRAKSCLAIS